MGKPSSEDAYSEEETVRRRESALKRMLSTPHKPHKPLGKKKTVGKQRKGRQHATSESG